MKINDTILDLDELVSKKNYGEITNIMGSLIENKITLIILRGIFLEDIMTPESEYTEDNASEIEDIDTQLGYLDINIKTLEDALLYFEAKIFEGRRILGQSGKLCLN